jgi:multidrug efflux system membrane fusion protein
MARRQGVRLKIILPLVILFLGIGIAWAMIAVRPESKSPAPPAEASPIRAIRVMPQTLTLKVRSQGVVTPRTEIDLVPEVSGRIVALHPSFATGGAFKAGDVLVTIDPRDYDLAVVRAQAQVAEAKRHLILEQEEAEQARREWEVLGEGKSPTSLAMRAPQLAEARAKLKAAEADLAKARLQRNRCEWRAPFAGRVREKLVGLGQYVQPGNILARLYASDVFEVRLPLAVNQLDEIDLPLRIPTDVRKSPAEADTLPRITLTARLSGGERRWEGHITRIEGAVDEVTGLFHAVAEIPEPFSVQHGNFPLLPGLFVQADITGQERTDVSVLPREAVDIEQKVFLIDEEDRLRARPVNVLRIEARQVWVSGLAEGERVVISGIQVPVEGLKVQFEIVDSPQAIQHHTVATKTLP